MNFDELPDENPNHLYNQTNHKSVGWVARSKTQLTHQHPRNVGFHSSTQHTIYLFIIISPRILHHILYLIL
jgi:hypothetical protein